MFSLQFAFDNFGNEFYGKLSSILEVEVLPVTFMAPFDLDWFRNLVFLFTEDERILLNLRKRDRDLELQMLIMKFSLSSEEFYNIFNSYGYFDGLGLKDVECEIDDTERDRCRQGVYMSINNQNNASLNNGW